jgi:anthranilate synthase/aminodeoxychorismate synthase-like glutamine amidotransferase
MILMIDNADSFTYNLVDLLKQGGQTVVTLRHERATREQLQSYAPDGLVISPGPGSPQQARNSEAALAYFSGKIPILGICLGYQVMGRTLGIPVTHSPQPCHGKTAQLRHNGEGVFRDLPQDFAVMRYHSLCCAPPTTSAGVTFSAHTSEGLPMALRAPARRWEGVLFHPESILTEHGRRMIQNWLQSIEAEH